jgi:RimJ/RimL family protein N-acetyltransferase
VTRAVHLPHVTRDRHGEVYQIRVANGKHASEYLTHMGRICSETPYMLQSAVDPMPDVDEQSNVLEHLRIMNNSACMLALRPKREPGRRVAGSITFLGGRTVRTQHLCTLGMGVDKEDWGLGIGSILLDAGLTWAMENPLLRRITLKVFPDNAQARHLYLSRGFEEDGELLREVCLPDGYISLIGMNLCVA